MDPGLVYDLTLEDHLNFFCAIGYNQSWIRQFSGRPYQCPDDFTIHNFNYPSITIGNLLGKATVTRKLKNVGTPSTYSARIREPAGVSIKVEPEILSFGEIGEEKSFKLTLEGKIGKRAAYEFGELRWSDGHHYVKSPIVVGSGKKKS